MLLEFSSWGQIGVCHSEGEWKEFGAVLGGGESPAGSRRTRTDAANRAGLLHAADSQRTFPLTPPVPRRRDEGRDKGRVWAAHRGSEK